MATDTSYVPKIYKKAGGDTLVVKEGGPHFGKLARKLREAIE